VEAINNKLEKGVIELLYKENLVLSRIRLWILPAMAGRYKLKQHV
jgi:hypothetical protein